MVLKVAVMTEDSILQLPEYLKSFEAFKLGEDISTVLKNAAKNLESELERMLRNEDEVRLRILLVCELIADSNGHPCWTGCWNIYLCELLFKTKYRGSSHITQKAVEALDRVSSQQSIRSSPQWDMSIASLKQRLIMPLKHMTRTNPIISKVSYRKIAPGFDRADQCFGLVDAIISAGDPTIQLVLDATSLKVESVNEINVHFATEPTINSVEAVRILLHRFRDHVSSFRCDAWSGPTGGQPSVMSHAFWNLTRREVLSLKKLDRFESWRFGIDDDTAAEILKIPSLVVFRVCKHEVKSEINQQIKIGNSFVNTLLQRGPIMVVDVPCLEANDQQRILAAMPDVILQIDGRRVYSAKQADEAVAQKQLEQQLATNAKEPENQSQDTGRNDPFYPFDVSCSKEDGIETATVGFGVFSKYDWALELESLDDYYLNGYGIAGLLQAIIHDNKLREKVDSIDAEGSDVLVTLSSWKAAKRLGKVAAKALRDEKKLRQLIARTRELGFED